MNNTENGKKVTEQPPGGDVISQQPPNEEKTPQNEDPVEKVANVQVSAGLEKSPEKAPPKVEKVIEATKPKEEKKVEEDDEEMPNLEDPDVKAVTAKLQKGFFARRLKKAGPAPPLPKKPTMIEKPPSQPQKVEIKETSLSKEVPEAVIEAPVVEKVFKEPTPIKETIEKSTAVEIVQEAKGKFFLEIKIVLVVISHIWISRQS